MGKLLKRKSRDEARKTERARRAAILEAAAHTFLHLPYTEVTLDAIGRRASVRQGIAAMYFNDREELFLRVLRSALDPWFERLTAELSVESGAPAPRELARRIARSLAGEEVATRLLGLLPTVLEHSVEPLPALDFSKWLRERADALGAAMEQCCPRLRPGDGIRFLARLYVLVVGLPRMANVSGIFAAAIRESAPAVAEADFGEALERLAAHLIRDPGGDAGAAV
jgi:AcrR family transcriptional regulator